MGMIGNQPANNFLAVTKDTFNGNASSYTLSKTATTNGVAVYVENVRQVPTTAYSVSGTTLTFTGTTPAGTGNVYVLHHNTPVSTATHPAAQALTATSGTLTNKLTVLASDGIVDNEFVVDIRNDEQTDDRSFGLRLAAGSTSTDRAFDVQNHAMDTVLFRILGDGKVGVGTGAPSVNLHIVEDASEGTPTFAGATHFAVQASASSSDNCNIAITSGSAGTSRIMFGDKDDEDPGKIEYDNNNNEFKFFTFQQQKLKVQENGTSVFKMKDTDGGTETAIWGSGTTSYIQAVSGELYARDSAGNNNLISPHNFEYIPDGASETHAWAFLNKKSDSNIKTEKDEDGKDVKVVDTTAAKDFTYVNVDMMKVVREVEKLTGTKLVYTGNQDGDDGSTVKDDIIAGLIKRIETLENK